MFGWKHACAIIHTTGTCIHARRQADKQLDIRICTYMYIYRYIQCILSLSHNMLTHTIGILNTPRAERSLGDSGAHVPRVLSLHVCAQLEKLSPLRSESFLLQPSSG